MFPFAAAPGTISGTRPTTTQPDAPLGDDDHTGLRVRRHLPNCRFARWQQLHGLAVALNGAANPSPFDNALTSLYRSAMTDTGWPPSQACIVPSMNISFAARTAPRPMNGSRNLSREVRNSHFEFRSHPSALGIRLRRRQPASSKQQSRSERGKKNGLVLASIPLCLVLQRRVQRRAAHRGP